ncbi:MAG: D-cysteine desulfhydrase family protein [Tissierellia bacterium]|nr:D-cysteine desulfhydrase family protein [Tissierellia bacterium]
MKTPNKIKLANTPTPIFEFNISDDIKDNTALYIKRDDYTGVELSGNKVRKLEFSIAEGLESEADVFITCGGIQSNHCRATASAAASLGKASHLLLRGDSVCDQGDGNLFLDKLFGAQISYITAEEYKNDRANIMKEIKAEYEKNGLKAYIIPEGASNGIGSFGYFDAYKEILEQESVLGIEFNMICVTEGSGGTYAGLYMANEVLQGNKKIVGFNIYDGEADVKSGIIEIINEACEIADYKEPINFDSINIINDYAGEGYGISGPEVFEYIKYLAKRTGIVFDPVYTGKMLFGLNKEIKNNDYFKGNILFIHTGGIFGVFPQKEMF